MHIGTMDQSGRYPRGSGKDPQRNKSFRTMVNELKKSGLKEKEIAQRFGMTIDSLRNKITVDKNNEDIASMNKIDKLKNTGMSNLAIARELGMTESTVRNFLDPERRERVKVLQTVSGILKQEADAKKYLDVGKGVEIDLGVNRTMLDAALYDLSNSGYKTQSVWVDQLGTTKKTEYKILTKDDVDYQDILANKGKIRTLSDFDDNAGIDDANKPVKILDADRIMIRYGDPNTKNNGLDKDGMIEVRPGVKDLTLPMDKMYGQARIAVSDDKTIGDTATAETAAGLRFMKGMVVQGDPKDFPPGVDVIYNTNKKAGVAKMDVLKPMASDDPTNPFGSSTWQFDYMDADGNPTRSAINLVGSKSRLGGLEGVWDTYKKSTPSQFLSKQDPETAKKQLGLAYDIEKAKYDEIMKITNPTLRKAELLDFAETSDRKAVDMAGAPFPGQAVKVLIGASTIKEGEVFCPAYKDGTTVSFVRYPYASNNELVTAVVNNKNKECLRMVGADAVDVVGFNRRQAAQASGADFDGDFATGIPHVGDTKLKIGKQIESLMTFDTKDYKFTPEEKAMPGYKPPSKTTRDTAIGKITNLATDMQAKGAPLSHVTDVTKASMVAVDVWKHELNLKKAYAEFNIPYYQKLYQGKVGGGAATILSKSTGDMRVDKTRPVKKGEPGYEFMERYGDYSIDKRTGDKVFKSIDFKPAYVTKDGTLIDPSAPYINNKGKLTQPKVAQMTVSRMSRESDARNLMSTNPSTMEIIYADNANRFKDLARTARYEAVNTVNVPYSASAAKVYRSTVEEINASIKRAESNAPKERMANLQAGLIVQAQRDANPGMSASDIRKASARALETTRLQAGAKRYQITITPDMAKAINAGAATQTTMQSLIKYADKGSLITAFSPRSSSGPSPAIVARAKAMKSNGFTIADIADQLGVSTSTLSPLL